MNLFSNRRCRTRLAGFNLLLFPIFFCLWGCAVGPDFTRPPPPPVEQYTTTEPRKTIPAAGQIQQFVRGKAVPEDWWRLFQSEKLDSLIRDAVPDNLSLAASQARLRQSVALWKASIGGFFPQFDGTFDVTREKFSPARFGGGIATGGNIFTLYTANASVNYNLDVFGGTRRLVEYNRAQVDFQAAEERATYITLVGNLVNAAISVASYRAQIEATEEIIAFEKEQLKATVAKEQAGLVPRLDVLSVETQIAATEATLPPLWQNLARTEHQLAVLAGRPPSAWFYPAFYLEELKLPNELPVVLPSNLVRQRPDILSSEALLHAASANIGIATANLLPNFNISAAYGQNSLKLENLFDSASNFWSLTGAITAPLFRGGTLWFQRKAAIYSFQEALANYRQTVLNALAQVADTLRALQNDAAAVQAQAKAVQTAKESLNLIEASYRIGFSTYLDLLAADTRYQQARIGYIQALAQRYLDTAALFVALGGGWWNQIAPVQMNAEGNTQTINR